MPPETPRKAPSPRPDQFHQPAVIAHCDWSTDPLIADGFGSRPDGEDPFGATVGLLGMLNVVIGFRSDEAPATQWLARWEGWMFGLQEFSRRDTPSPPILPREHPGDRPRPSA